MTTHGTDSGTLARRRSKGLLSSGIWFVGAQERKAILPPCSLLPSPTASEMLKFEMTPSRLSTFAPVSFPKEAKCRYWIQCHERFGVSLFLGLSS